MDDGWFIVAGWALLLAGSGVVAWQESDTKSRWEEAARRAKEEQDRRESEARMRREAVEEEARWAKHGYRGTLDALDLAGGEGGARGLRGDLVNHVLNAVDEELLARALRGARSRPARLNSLSSSTTKTSADLARYLRETVPVFVHRYLVQAGSVKQCGSISDAFGTVARDAGFEAYVASRPGHFYNVVRVADGVFEVDLSAIQFEYDRDTDYMDSVASRAENDRLLRAVAEDPFRAMKVRRLQDVPPSAREPSPENESCFYTPVKDHARRAATVQSLMRGEYDHEFDRALVRLLEGRPYAHKMTVDLGDLGRSR